MNHLLKLADLSDKDILDILNYADQLKYEHKNGIEHKLLKGKTLGMIFAKASTRTRVSFEVGMCQLGGQALYLNSHDLQIGRGEPMQDTARALSRYLDCIMIRTYRQKDVEDLAFHGSIPVINGLTDDAHPCQILADLMTVRELKKTFKKIKLCYIGDGNNVANSLIVGCVKLGIQIVVACPENYRPMKSVLDWAMPTGLLRLTEDVLDAAKDADVLYTDVWASMGQEGEAKERIKAFQGYQINSMVMSYAKKDAIVLHCLPAHRGEEITEKILEQHAAEIFEQAENRLHVQKAVLVKLLSK